MPRALDYGIENVATVVADVYGIDVTARGSELFMLCPNPGHPERSPSCSVNEVTGYYHCFSCGVGGDIVDLGVLTLKIPKDAVRDLLSPSSPEGRLTSFRAKLARLSVRERPKRRPMLVPDHNDTPDFSDLYRRRFTDVTLDRWDIRYVEHQHFANDRNGFDIKHSIAIPIKDRDDFTRGWCYRSTERSPSWQPRYLYTPEFPVAEQWFGLQHYADADEVGVVEGSLDTMWMDQCGIPALGLLGSQMGQRKINWLRRFRRVVLFPDYDKAGVLWTIRVAEMIGTSIPLYIAGYSPWMLKKTPEQDGSYRPAKDPEELRPIDAEIAYARAMAYPRWRMRLGESSPHLFSGKSRR